MFSIDFLLLLHSVYVRSLKRVDLLALMKVFEYLQIKIIMRLRGTFLLPLVDKNGWESRGGFFYRNFQNKGICFRPKLAWKTRPGRA